MWRGRGANDPFIILPSAVFRLLSCLSSIPPVSPSRYCRARIWDTIFHYRVRVTNHLSPVTDIGEISRHSAVRTGACPSLCLHVRTTSHLTETLTNVFAQTSAKLRAERTRFKRVGNTEQIALYFLAIGSIRHARCMGEKIPETIASLIWPDS